MARTDNWQDNYEALKAYAAQTGHSPNKHTKLNNWCSYQRKRMKAGLITTEQKELFEALAASRSDEHTGGRKKSFPDTCQEFIVQGIIKYIYARLRFSIHHNPFMELRNIPGGNYQKYSGSDIYELGALVSRRLLYG